MGSYQEGAKGMEELDGLKGSRARFLGAAGITGAAIAAGTWKTTKAGAALAPTRSYAAGRFALVLDGSTGYLHSVDGGGVAGEVVGELGSADYYQRKHIGNVKYEDFAVELGLSMSKAVYDWIALSLQGSYRRKSGEVVALDLNNAVRSSREFKEALITEIGFPAMDASSKDPAYMTVKFSPEQTERKKGSGATLTPESTKQQKTWLPSNFRFELKGLPTSKINKIDALTIKQTVVTDDIGETRDYTKEPGKLEFPNVVLTLAESDAQPWLDWFEEFVIRGNNGQEQEKSGSLVYLSPNLQEELGRLDFFNLGIFRVAEEKTESSSDQIRRIKVELYCERLEFKLPGMSRDG